jgi:hypothetical protein
MSKLHLLKLRPDHKICSFLSLDHQNQNKSCLFYAGCTYCPGSGNILTEYSGIITDGPGNIHVDVGCTWIINPANATWVVLKFSHFQMERATACCFGDPLSVFECTDTSCLNGKLLLRAGGTLAEMPPEIVSKTGIMKVTFSSDWQSALSGFDGVYFTPCPENFYGPGQPQCFPCRTSCPNGTKLVVGSCGTIGAILDNKCVCSDPPSRNIEQCVGCVCPTGDVFYSHNENLESQVQYPKFKVRKICFPI